MLAWNAADRSQAGYAELQTQGTASKLAPLPNMAVSVCIPVVTCPALQVKVASGSILVRPLTHAWAHECGALLTGAFADAMGYVPMYRSVS